MKRYIYMLVAVLAIGCAVGVEAAPKRRKPRLSRPAGRRGLPPGRLLPGPAKDAAGQKGDIGRCETSPTGSPAGDKRTKAEIAANDKAVKTGLADLGRISSQIADSRKQVADMPAQVGRLNGQIGSLQGEISVGEKEVARMRQKYPEAVKKMRLKKGNRSALAFIFSSESFSQATEGCAISSSSLNGATTSRP